MTKVAVTTDKAPAAIGTYSQAVMTNTTVYLSGQIPLDPVTMTMVAGDIRQQLGQVFENLRAVSEAAGGSLEQVVKLTVYLIDLQDFPVVNEVMGQYFQEPYPARAVVEVSALPKEARVEIDAVLHLG